MYVCVGVCVCERERGGKRETDTDLYTDRHQLSKSSHLLTVMFM